MQLSQRQQQTLAAMDIPVWQLRDTTREIVEAVATVETATTADVDLSPTVWVVSASTVIDDNEQRLLNAMLKAVGLSRQTVAMLNKEQVKAVAVHEMSNKMILVLGNLSELMPVAADPAQPEKVKYGADSCWIATYSLREILATPSLKAFVWQALKLLKTSD